MVGFLAKTPLTALIFAALLHFFMSIVPFSQGYSDALAAFSMPLTGYIFIVAYGLWLSIIIAQLYTNAHAGGIKLALLLTVPLFGSQWLVPSFYQFYYGEPAGVMARSDLLFSIACSCASGLLLLVLASLLFKRPPGPDASKNTPQKPHDKYKIKKLDLAVKLIVLPIIYIFIYFLVWYFLLWRSEAVRVYYTGSAEHRTFIEEIINMLLTNASRVPVALIEGFAYTIILLPLMIQLASKRVMFIVTTVMLFAGSAVRMLIPNPIMPDAVRMAYLIEIAAISAIFGGLASFMLHTSIRKEEAPKPPVAAAKPKPASDTPTPFADKQPATKK